MLTPRSYVEQMAQLKINGRSMLAVEFLAKHGKDYVATQPTSTPMTPKMCYSNAMMVAIKGGRYVEGYGMLKGLMPLSHAWNLDGNDQVIDHTWPSNREATYIGVEFQTEFVLEFQGRVKMSSIFESLYALRMSIDDTMAYLESGIAK